MLRDELWAPFGSGRHQRTADNPHHLVEQLDSIAGHRRDKSFDDVSWIDPAADRMFAILLALLPLLAGASPWLVRRLRRGA
jgi:hypothetical protein